MDYKDNDPPVTRSCFMYKMKRKLLFQMYLVHVPHFLLQLELLWIQTCFSLESIAPKENVTKK